METTSGAHDLVIARHEESLDWVLDVPEVYRVHIYDKGASPVAPAVRDRAESYVALRNAGREADTYLTHLLEYGPGTGEFTVFTQADPFEHSPDFLELLALHADWTEVQSLSWCWKAPIGFPPAALLTPERSLVPGVRVRPELFSLNTFHPLEWVGAGPDWIGGGYRELHRLPAGINISAHFLDMCELPDIAELAQQHLVGRSSIGAIFGVRNHLIEKVPERALVRLRQAAIGAPVHGYFCERLWMHIFGESFLFPLRLPGAS
ncbi:hypothetical protein AB0H76_26870 [Nocardia sp. NPDC050712]|uniref:hypothetical protein n=1 Tax=Nocardia sp. NPDC050712 TaxID=3155518 RepID=UPI0033CC55D0